MIAAPPINFVPPQTGVGTPFVNAGTSADGGAKEDEESKGGLQEEIIHRDAWKGILDALKKIKAAREAEQSSMAIDK